MILEELDGNVGVYFGFENIGIIGGEFGSNEIGLYFIDNFFLGNSYIGQYDIVVGYLMMILEFGKLKVIVGVCVEIINVLVESDIVFDECEKFEFDFDCIDCNSVSIDILFILFVLNFVYVLIDNVNLCMSVIQIIVCLNMWEVVFFGVFGVIGEFIIFGNFDLMLINIINFDLCYEIFLNSGEVFVVSVFYKKFIDFIVFIY